MLDKVEVVNNQCIPTALTHDLLQPLFQPGGELGWGLTGHQFTPAVAIAAKVGGQTGVRLARRVEKARPRTVPACAPDW